MDTQVELTRLAIHTIKIAPKQSGSGSGYGKPSFGADVEYKGRVTTESTQVRTPGGDEVTSQVRADILGDVSPLSFDSRVTLPDGTQPPILSIKKVYGEETVHHVSIFF